MVIDSLPGNQFRDRILLIFITPGGVSTTEEGVEYENGNTSKRPAWNKLSLNGRARVGAAAAEAEPLIGAHRGGYSGNPNSTTTPICPIFTRRNVAGTSFNGFVSQSHDVNDHYKHYNPYMNHNGGNAKEAGPLMGAHLWSVSQGNGGRRANSVSQQQVSNNIGNPNSTKG
ncbi:hypothetical protein Q3G72_031457 [Acer saccharum]|nr:hypothetical protein Q3G72_031457 [Acer saccharum]